jgi:hypothetical protein
MMACSSKKSPFNKPLPLQRPAPARPRRARFTHPVDGAINLHNRLCRARVLQKATQSPCERACGRTGSAWARPFAGDRSRHPPGTTVHLVPKPINRAQRSSLLLALTQTLSLIFPHTEERIHSPASPSFKGEGGLEMPAALQNSDVHAAAPVLSSIGLAREDWWTIARQIRALLPRLAT